MSEPESPDNGIERLVRCDSGIRQLLRMTDEEIVAEKNADLARLADVTEDEQGVSPLIVPHPVYGKVELSPAGEPPLISALVDFAGNRDDLTALGIGVRSDVQNVFVVRATRKQLHDLASRAATARISLPRLLFADSKDALAAAEIDQAQSLGSRGKGTLVGVIDTEIDLEHMAFRKAAPPNKTRVGFLWVQFPDSVSGAPLPGMTPKEYTKSDGSTPDFSKFDYGRIYDSAAIDTALASGSVYGTGTAQIAKKPSSGEHGTHVAGTAAGVLAGGQVGASPEADLIYVDLDQRSSGFQDGSFEDNALDALEFMLAVKAYEDKQSAPATRPLVINNSYGTNLGPHNGKTAFDTARNAMLDSHLGRLLVFAAGNDDDDEGFKEGTIAAGDTALLEMTLKFLPGDRWLEIWSEGPALEFKADSKSYSSNWLSTTQEHETAEKWWRIEVTRDLEPVSQMHNLRLYVQGQPSGVVMVPIPPHDASWKIWLRNPSATTKARYFAWTAPHGKHASLASHSTGRWTIQDTACARALLAVGACDKPASGNPELVAKYSSRGPTLDQRIKPEIVAVGTGVIAANSTTKSGTTGKTGTSMAAPVVAGTVALLFEQNPALAPDTVKLLLTKHANREGLDLDPKLTGFDENERNAYGEGRLRVLDALGQSYQQPNVDVFLRNDGKDSGEEPFPRLVFWQAPDVEVLDGSGKPATTLRWDQKHTVRVRVYNRGKTPAIKTRIAIKYTRPWAAPKDWEPCTDATPGRHAIDEKVNVPALDKRTVTFSSQWVPRRSQVTTGGSWGDHYCLLVELDHPQDKLHYDDKTAAGRDPWVKNIKGSNNIALRNLHIQ